MASAFPISWNKSRIQDIQIPKVYQGAEDQVEYCA
jgi:hypothetical protein